MPRPKSDIEPRVIEAARARFLRQGVDGASLRKIAEDADTNIGMIYYYFPTKDDLFLAVVEDVYADFLDDLTAALAPDVVVEDRLRRLFDRVARISAREYDVVRLVLREAMVSSTRLGSLVERFSRGHLPLVVATIQDGLADGVLDPRHPLPAILATLGTLAIFPQLVRRRADTDLPHLRHLLPKPPELADALLHIALRGLRPPPRD